MPLTMGSNTIPLARPDFTFLQIAIRRTEAVNHRFLVTLLLPRDERFASRYSSSSAAPNYFHDETLAKNRCKSSWHGVAKYLSGCEVKWIKLGHLWQPTKNLPMKQFHSFLPNLVRFSNIRPSDRLPDLLLFTSSHFPFLFKLSHHYKPLPPLPQIYMLECQWTEE